MRGAVGPVGQPPSVDAADGVAATSRDGSTWTVTPVAGSTELADVAFAGEYAFAVGAPTVFAPPASLQIWRSADGIAWQRLAGPPPVPDAVSFRAVDIATTVDRIVIAGWAEARRWPREFVFMSPPGARHHCRRPRRPRRLDGSGAVATPIDPSCSSGSTSGRM
jgi:hypothetical protein